METRILASCSENDASFPQIGTVQKVFQAGSVYAGSRAKLSKKKIILRLNFCLSSDSLLVKTNRKFR